jgi:hypothetical protein
MNINENSEAAMNDDEKARIEREEYSRWVQSQINAEPEPKTPEPQVQQVSKEFDPNNPAFGCLIFVIFVLIMFYLFRATFGSQTASVPKVEEFNHFTFIRQCRELITAKLKAPSTAQFEDDIEANKHLIVEANGNYTLVSYVDAQNSFGAMLRMRTSCDHDKATKTVGAKILE